MNGYNVKRSILSNAIQAEIFGMVAENKDRESNGYAMAYTAKDFNEKAEELRILANTPDEEL